MVNAIISAQNEVRRKAPLIHCITNPISINMCANAVLATGARPVMAEHPGEVCGICKSAAALLLNLGSITDVRMKSILLSAQTAKENNIPAVLDLVGISCSELRRNFAQEIIKTALPAIIKGNYSEIRALYDKSYKSSGVDADKSIDKAEAAYFAAELSAKLGSVVMASGKTDIICDGQSEVYVYNGCAQLGRITGTGCMLGALTACFAAVYPDITGAASACSVLGICGELSQTQEGNGSFEVKLMDNLSLCGEEKIKKHLKIEVNVIEKN